MDNTQWKDTFQLEKTDEEFFSGTRVSTAVIVYIGTGMFCAE